MKWHHLYLLTLTAYLVGCNDTCSEIKNTSHLNKNQGDFAQMSGLENWNFVNALGDSLFLNGNGITFSFQTDTRPAEECNNYHVERKTFSYSNDSFNLVYTLTTQPDNEGLYFFFTFKAASFTGFSQFTIDRGDTLMGSGFTFEDSIQIQGVNYYNVQVNYNRRFVYSKKEGLLRFDAKWPWHDGVRFERISS
jgi:hypothetical protein